MSDPVVYAVFTSYPNARQSTLAGVFIDLGDAQMCALRLCGDGYDVALRQVAVHEARKLELIPSVFAPVDWDALPGQRVWTDEDEEGEE